MDDDSSSLYPYTPSLGAAILFTALYSVLAVVHIYLQLLHPWLRNRTTEDNNPNRLRRRHNHTIPTAIAAVLSTAGFAGRIVSTRHLSSIGLYAMSSSLIVISPIFVCASLYLLLSRLIGRCLPATAAGGRTTTIRRPQTFCKIPPRRLGWIFVTSDVVSFLTQACGISIAAGAEWEGDSAEIGTHILRLGLCLQLLTFTIYIFMLWWRFVRRVKLVQGGFEPRVKSLLVGVAIACVSVEVRSVYRVVEFALGLDGYPFQNEWPLYVMEAVPMLLAIAALGWWHPVRLLPEGMVPEEKAAVVATDGMCR